MSSDADMKNHVWRSCTQRSTSAAEDFQEQHSQRRQYLVTFLVNISAFVAGNVYGWPAPLLPVLQSESSPVGIPPISDNDASWLASIYCISRIITTPIYMYTVDRLGCKITGYLVAAPFFLSYIMLLFANSMSMLFWGRFISGIAAGGTGILVPTYTIDISEDYNKGKLSTIYAQSMNVGLTFAYAMGYYTSYKMFHACSLLLTVIFTLAMFWLPESPLFLLTAGKTEQARNVLKWLRNDKENELEFERIKQRAQEVLEKRNQKVSVSDMTDRRMLRGLFICLGLTLNQQMSGIGPVVSYTVTIFQQAGAAIPPNITTILLGVVQIVGAHFSTMAVERSGRRFLLITSDIVVTLCLIVVGAYFYFKSSGWNMECVGWLPIASLFLYMLSIGVGLGVLPFTIATELVHPNYRSFVQAANVIMLSVSCFVPTVTYVPLVGMMGEYGCFWLYAAFCAVGAVCIYLTLPETKNRSLEDVLEQMGSDHFINSVRHYKKKSNTEAKFSLSDKISSNELEYI